MLKVLHLATAIRRRTRWVRILEQVFGGTTFRHYHRRLLGGGVTALGSEFAGPTLDFLDLEGIGRVGNGALRSAIRRRTRTG